MVSRHRAAQKTRGGARPGTHEKPERHPPRPAHIRKRKPLAKRPSTPVDTDLELRDPERWDGLG